jgi:uncharacterized protein YjbJ (UPF0337 family)
MADDGSSVHVSIEHDELSDQAASRCANLHHRLKGDRHMNKNQIKGSAKELSGKTREVTGKLLGTKELESKGKIKKNAGKIQKGVGDIQQDIKRSQS